MKKDRNSFFESSNFNMSAMGQNMNPMMGPNMGMPNTMNTASANFYASQNIPMPTPLPAYPNMNPSNSSMTELESRISKLERNINRLDARLSKLEGNAFNNTTNYDDGNMYMV